MRDEYDFSKARKNPYATQLKKSITIRLDEDSVAYFKGISEEVGIPYQTLINLYLRDCAASHRKLNLHWKWDCTDPISSARFDSAPGHQKAKPSLAITGAFFVSRKLGGLLTQNHCLRNAWTVSESLNKLPLKLKTNYHPIAGRQLVQK